MILFLIDQRTNTYTNNYNAETVIEKKTLNTNYYYVYS